MTSQPKAPRDMHSAVPDDATLARTLANLPQPELSGARAQQALDAAQASLAQRFAPRPWLVWYEQRLEPGLLAAACALYLAWAAGAAIPPAAPALAHPHRAPQAAGPTAPESMALSRGKPTAAPAAGAGTQARGFSQPASIWGDVGLAVGAAAYRQIQATAAATSPAPARPSQTHSGQSAGSLRPIGPVQASATSVARPARAT